MFDPRANSLNALRLALALLVLVAHAAELGGYGRELQPLGAWAVTGFFCISGYLITGSREHSASLRDFLWRRFLRIYPGFLTTLVVVAFVIAPAAGRWAGAGEWSPQGATSYVLRNLAVWIFQPDIDGMLGSTPFPGVWNGSLWTLGYEALCYLIVGALSLFPGRPRRVCIVVLFLVSTVIVGLHSAGIAVVPGTVSTFSGLLSSFLAGGLLYLCRDHVVFHGAADVVAATLVVALAALGVAPGLASLPVASLLMSASVRLPLARIGTRNDISYGVYIYAFPAQQVLACLFPDTVLPLWAFIGLSIAVTLPLAWASWLFVERPALRAKSLFARTARSRHIDRGSTLSA
ncbi:acyltransferase family protein [Microbacterium hydrothermale]|uniref:acyltransferase family protein n=1 Tax=Microbacterium hydrothermale TaxID=857427 RepID=UPI00142DBECE|nr:acyltransferase [Microbacterium hydrothermale]